MNRIDQTFARLRAEQSTALIPFLTIGDPSVEMSIEIVMQMEKAGADMIELGVPYSDPLADGPVIQRSSERALKHHVTILDCMQVARSCRERGSKLPFVLFTYFNPVLQLGLERFLQLVVEHEISGLIIPDLPIEEHAEMKALSAQFEVHLIPLVAPTSNDRIRKIAAEASGFVYCVSSLGVTGTRTTFYSGIDDFLATVRNATSLPIAVGFGISNREQVLGFASKCDGVVVGSAIVRKIEETLPLLQSNASVQEGLLQIHDFVRQLKA